MDEKLRILLCEDDENLGMLLREYLQAKGYSAELYPDGEAGYKAFLKNKYDLCVFDVMMPKKDGFTLAQDVRAANAEIPIIFLTAKTLKEDILEGFKIGADDYITKPFGVMELISRVKAVIRRSDRSKGSAGEVLKIGELVLDEQKHEVYARGQEVSLTFKEFELLSYLMKNRGLVLSRDKILNTIWNYEYEGESRTVDVHIGSLRQKLGTCGDFIKTIRGIGYKIED